MMQLLFIRHAETDLAGTFCGHADPALNAAGQAQLQLLIAQIGFEEIDEVWTSDLRRASETANALAEAWGIPCLATGGLREIYFGEWEAMPWAEIERSEPEFARRWVESFPHVTPPGGEPYSVFEDRVLRMVERLSVESEHKRIAVVTHAGVMRVVLCRLLGYSEEEAWAMTKPYCCCFVYAPALAAKEVSG